MALTNKLDSVHEQALALPSSFGFATDCHHGGAAQGRRECPGRFGRAISHSNPHTAGLFLDGLALYEARPDKGYSLTDCISMLIMRREGLTDVLSNDRHFEQEGFRVLLRDA